MGLAQLHQLRGRIARSSLPSNCVLLHDHNLSENAVKRLLILKNSNDGFKIAEKDLELRGAGDFLGRINQECQDGDFLDIMKT